MKLQHGHIDKFLIWKNGEKRSVVSERMGWSLCGPSKIGRVIGLASITGVAVRKILIKEMGDMGDTCFFGSVITDGGMSKGIYLIIVQTVRQCTAWATNYSRNQCLTWHCTVLGFEAVLRGGKHVCADSCFQR